MGSNKRGGGADALYRSHLFGDFDQYQPNQAVNRERSIALNHQRNLSEMAVNRFQWKGLPASVDPQFLEKTLFYTALCVFYWDKEFDKVLAVRGAGAGYVNMLDNPVTFTVVGPSTLTSSVQEGMAEVTGIMNKTPIAAYDPTRHDGSSAELKQYCVPVWANTFRYPDIDLIMIYSQRLAWLDRTLEINTKNARRTKILKTSQNMQLSAVNVARSLDQGDELIQITGPMQDMDFVEALDLGVNPDAYEKLSLYRTRVWNEIVGLLGINHANQDKKERLVSAEVGANDDQVSTMQYVALNARQLACERINKVFGLDVSVDFRTNFEEKAAIEDAQAAEADKASNAENPKGEDKEKEAA